MDHQPRRIGQGSLVQHHILTSLEFTRLEPGVIDKKIYAPGIGIVLEQSQKGPLEVAKLVSVRG